MNFDEKLHRVVARQDELGAMLSTGKVEAKDFARFSKEFADLGPVVAAIQALQKARAELSDLDAMLTDPAADQEMKTLAEDERIELGATLPKLEREVQLMLIPKDETDERNAIL